MCFSASALCHCETVDVRACLLRVCPSTWYVYPPRRGQRHSSCVRVCPNHSNSSTGLQHQQQQQCSFTSVVPSPGTAGGKPCSCCCGGQDVSHNSSNTVDTTLSGNVMPFLFIILTPNRSLHFRTYWSKEEHVVRVFNAMLAVIFISQQSVHFRTGGI